MSRIAWNGVGRFEMAGVDFAQRRVGNCSFESDECFRVLITPTNCVANHGMAHGGDELPYFVICEGDGFFFAFLMDWQPWLTQAFNLNSMVVIEGDMFSYMGLWGSEVFAMDVV